MSWLSHIGITIGSFFLEVGWVVAVLFVTRNAALRLVLITGVMQLVSYLTTKIIVADDWTMLSGSLGAMVGAWFGMRWQTGMSETTDPTSKRGLRSYGPSSDGVYGGVRRVRVPRGMRSIPRRARGHASAS